MGYYWTLIALLAVGRKASAGCDVLVQETEDMGVRRAHVNLIGGVLCHQVIAKVGKWGTKWKKG